MRRVLLLIASLTVGCNAAGDPYVGALPTRAAVAINVPGASTGTSSAREEALLGAQATFYMLTRQISTGVNDGAAMFFGLVEKLTATPPTAHDATHSYWGPFTDALSPMAVELGVNRVDAQDYMFFLGGKPKGAPDSAFMGLFGGTAHRVDATHGSGELDINFTELNALDPTVHAATGGISFKHDNTADPRTVDVQFGDFFDGTPGSTPLNALYHYAEHADQSGNFAFALRTDFDHDPNGDLENVALTSRWLATGAGRAELVATGGSLPAGFVVHATECWSATFTRVFYTEDVDPSKTEGDVSACALP